MKIGFIGTGVMGTGIINNLLKAKFSVNVFNRTKTHAQAVIDEGAIWKDSPKEIARFSDVVITMVGFPKDVEEVYFGEQGIFAGSHSGQLLIDMTTSSPKLAKKIYLFGKNKQINVLDAPVSGGDIGARNATLSIMVGGDVDNFNKAKVIFEVIGKSAELFGGAGSGQYMKMANQIMIAGTMTGMTEAIVYARAANLDLDKAIKVISSGAGQNWSMDNYAPRIISHDYTPGFFAKHFLKDLRIALDSAQDLAINLPATKQAEELYQIMVDKKRLGDDGTQALIKIYDN